MQTLPNTIKKQNPDKQATAGTVAQAGTPQPSTVSARKSKQADAAAERSRVTGKGVSKQTAGTAGQTKKTGSVSGKKKTALSGDEVDDAQTRPLLMRDSGPATGENQVDGPTRAGKSPVDDASGFELFDDLFADEDLDGGSTQDKSPMVPEEGDFFDGPTTADELVTAKRRKKRQTGASGDETGSGNGFEDTVMKGLEDLFPSSTSAGDKERPVKASLKSSKSSKTNRDAGADGDWLKTSSQRPNPRTRNGGPQLPLPARHSASGLSGRKGALGLAFLV